MANLQRTHHQLEKARKKLEKYSKSQKQFQINFVREPNKKGKYRTKANIVRDEKNYQFSNKGLLHKIANQKYRITGDKPSVTKTLQAIQSKTFKGKFAKKSAQTVNFIMHSAVQTATNTALVAETVGIKTFDETRKTVYRKYVQKYKQEALDDYHKGVITTGGIVADAVKGTGNHFRQKKQFRLEKAKYKIKKAEYKLHKEEQFKPKLAKSRATLKANKTDFKKQKKAFKQYNKHKKIVTSEDKFNKNIRKDLQKRRTKKFKLEKKKSKNAIKQLKTDKKFQAKIKRKQWRIADLSRPAPIVLKPVAYTSKRMTASGWQKAVNADENNDFLKVADEVKRHSVDTAVQQMNPQRLKSKNQKKKQNLEKKQDSRQQKLRRQENKLNEKSETPKRKKKPTKPKNHSFSERFQEALKKLLNFVKNVYEKEVKKFFMILLLPILIIGLILAFILMIFSGILSGSGFILGTYASQDYDLSQAEIYYTELAYNMNQSVLKVGTSDWKKGLKELGADTSKMKDNPDNFYWGYSDKFAWNPEYDFDTWKLWAFLCAYYYDFSKDNGDIKYWKYGSDTENLLEEIFNAEYTFKYNYDNTSHWEELSNYNYFGGGSAETGSYYRCETSAYIYDGQPYRYRFKPKAYTSELSQYFDSEGYVCINSNYRVLNPNDNYEPTGYMIMDNRWYSGNKEPFYYCDNGTFFFMAGGERHDRSFWGWNGEDSWFMISPTDTQIWNYEITDSCMYGYYQKYYWKEDCRLYYNVQQNKSFDKVIEDKLKSMDNSSERLEYYNLLVGNESCAESLYGNHQTFKNILSGDSLKSYGIINGFGYDMQKWNRKHCSLTDCHNSVDIVCNSGSELYAPFDCKITDVDTENHIITLRKDDVFYWYDGNGGTKRDTEIAIGNATLLSGFSKGDTLKSGECFAKSTGSKKCNNTQNSTAYDYIHLRVYIDTDGYGWDYVDPRLVFY